jgi:tRNA G18 (ribose-2'-O)-methylase SpoU
MYNAGTKIDSQTLYERQQEANSNNLRDVAPVIIATGLRTPDNIASILRIAEAAYSTRVIFVTDKNQKIEFDNKIKRLSRDTDKELNIEQYEVDEFLKACHELPEMIAIEITTESKDIFNTTFSDKCSLVVGSESHGINNQVLEKCQRAVHIPMYGRNGSMNVSHALAISLFEWRRQKQLI